MLGQLSIKFGGSSMSVASTRRHFDDLSTVTNPLNKHVKQSISPPSISTLPPEVLRKIYGMLGTEVFALSAASKKTRHDLYDAMRDAYDTTPSLRDYRVATVSKPASESGSSAAGAAACLPMQNLALREIPATYARIVKEGNSAKLHGTSFEYSPLDFEKELSAQMRRDAELPFHLEGPAKTFVNPLDTSNLSMRVAAIQTAENDKLARRFHMLFPTDVRHMTFSRELGLLEKKRLFHLDTQAQLEREFPRWFADNIDLFLPYFSHFTPGSEMLAPLYSFLEQEAESSSGEEKARLLRFIDDFKSCIEGCLFSSKELMLAKIKTLFLEGIQSNSLSYLTLSRFFDEFISFYPNIKALGDPDLVALPGLQSQPSYQITKDFFIAITKRKTDFTAGRLQSWMNDKSVKVLLERRDEYFLFFVIVQTILSEANKKIAGCQSRITRFSFNPDIIGTLALYKEKILFVKGLLASLESVQPSLGSHPFRREFEEIKQRFSSLQANLSGVTEESWPRRDRTLLPELRKIIELLKTYTTELSEKLVNEQGYVDVLKFLGLIDKDFTRKFETLRIWLETRDANEVCAELTDLDLSSMGISNIPAGLLRKLPNLRILHISNNALSAVPEEIASLRHLRMLYLDNNFISTIPEFIWKLPRLSMLSFRGCYIHKLDSFLFGSSTLAPLQILDLEDNCLESIPEGLISSLPSIKEVLLSWNHLTSLPSDIDKIGILPDRADAQLFLSNNHGLRQANIPPSVWNSTIPFLADVMNDLKHFKHDREYVPNTPLATFYKALVFRRSQDDLSSLFTSFSSSWRTLIGLAIWNYWDDWRQSRILDGFDLSEDLADVHGLHTTLTREEKALHGIQHIYDSIPVLFAVIEKVHVAVYYLLTPEQKAALYAHSPELAHTPDEDPEEISGACTDLPMQFIDALHAVGQDGIETIISENLESLADM